MSHVAARWAACVATRRLAADSLATALRELLAQPEPISEIALRDRWLAQMRREPSIYVDGWYVPPPHGIILLFATEADPRRLSHPSYRAAETWPRDNVYLDRQQGLIMAYASPVDRPSGIMGDFGVTLYLGNNPALQAHLAKCLSLTQTLARETKDGMTLAEVARRGDELLAARDMRNEVLSTTDPAGADFGHTVSGIAEGWSSAEQAIFESGDWPASTQAISHKRRFVSRSEKLVLTDGMAITLEPRPSVVSHPELPQPAYHTILGLVGGQKQFLTDFDELFALAGMPYMPKFAL